MTTQFYINDDEKDRLMRYIFHVTTRLNVLHHKNSSSLYVFNVGFEMNNNDKLILNTLLASYVQPMVLHTIIFDYMSSIELTCKVCRMYNTIYTKFHYESELLYSIDLRNCHYAQIQPYQIVDYFNPVMPVIPYIILGDKYNNMLSSLLFNILRNTWCHAKN